MKLRLRVTAAVCVLAVPADSRDTTLAPWGRVLIGSPKLGEVRTILVATPDGYENGAERFRSSFSSTPTTARSAAHLHGAQ